MTTFESPLGKKKVVGHQMREFDIPDESEFIENSVNPVFNAQRARAAKATAGIDEQAIHNFQSKLPSEEELLAAERDIQAARAARRTGKERLPEGAKRRIDILLGMTRTSRKCDVGETTFLLQSLKAKEMREAIMLASEFDGTVQSSFEIRKQFLARSLVQIGEIDIGEFIGSDTLESKLIFIEELDDVLLNRLYDEYLALTKEAKEKYYIKTEADVQEVVSDLKK